MLTLIIPQSLPDGLKQHRLHLGTAITPSSTVPYPFEHGRNIGCEQRRRKPLWDRIVQLNGLMKLMREIGNRLFFDHIYKCKKYSESSEDGCSSQIFQTLTPLSPTHFIQCPYLFDI